jgi:glycerol kinase
MQIQADVLGVPVVRPANVETTAVGAAYLAGIGSGLWPSQASVLQLWRIDRTFEPLSTEAEREARYGTWKRAVERARAWVA